MSHERHQIRTGATVEARAAAARTQGEIVMWPTMKPQIRCCQIITAAGFVKFVVWTPHADGYPRPWPARTWQDALDAVADWYAGKLM